MIKKIFTGIILLSATTMATADDQKTNYDWTGAYGGISLGSTWSKTTLEANHEGFISGTTAYSPHINTADTTPGFQFGYLHQFDHNVVAGIEADFTFPASNGDYKSDNIVTGNSDQFNIRNNLQSSLKLRTGYAMDHFMPFVTTGISFANTELHYGNSLGNSYSSNASQSGWTQGWVIGGGLEYSVCEHLLLRSEYLYTNYGDTLNMGMPVIGGVADSSGAAHANVSTNVLKFGLNYKF